MGGMKQIPYRRPTRTNILCIKFCRPPFVRPGLSNSFCSQKPTTAPYPGPDESHGKYSVWLIGRDNIYNSNHLGINCKVTVSINCKVTVSINCKITVSINWKIIVSINCKITVSVNCKFTVSINCKFTVSINCKFTVSINSCTTLIAQKGHNFPSFSEC
jgi:hypothetical protein